MLLCHACGTEVPPAERIGRREACARCGAELHCCRNCRFYAPGMHNDCAESQAERVVDKERANFCEYFAAGAPAQPGVPGGEDTRSQLERIFAKKKSG